MIETNLFRIWRVLDFPQLIYIYSEIKRRGCWKIVTVEVASQNIGVESKAKIDCFSVC